MPTVLVTGASRGLGLEFARQYRADGWTVIATARRPEAVPLVVRTAGVELLPLDVADPASVAALAGRLGERPIDLVINNAGIYGPDHQAFSEVSAAAFEEALRTNLIGPVIVSQALLVNLRASEQRKLIAITSKMGSISDNTSGGEIIYRASKAALNMAMHSVAIDLARHGVTVAVLHPGWVRTDMGGPSAPLPTSVSVAGMRRVIDSLTQTQSGRFFNYDGTEIPW